METLGDRLRTLRKEKGVTLEVMAKDLDTTRVTLSRYETGVREPKNDTLNILASYFNVSVDYLLGRCDKSNKNIFSVANDYKAMFDNFLEKSNYSSTLMFDGEPMTEEEYESFMQSLQVVIDVAKQRHDKRNK